MGVITMAGQYVGSHVRGARVGGTVWSNIPTRPTSEKFHCSPLLRWGQGSRALGHTQEIPTPQHIPTAEH